MDAKQAQNVVNVVDSVVGELRRLRAKRMGSLSTARVLMELEAINAGVASGNGLLLREKLTWFKHDLIEREIGNLRALMNSLQDCLQDSDVQNEITQEGFSIPVTKFSMSQMQRLIGDLSAVDNKHHELIEKALGGKDVSSQELAEYEEFILQLNDLEERVEAYATGTLQEYKPYIGKLKKAPPAWLPRIAAGLILSVAAAGAMMLGTAKAYAQETAQSKPPIARTSTIDDQISMLEAKPNKTPQETFKLAELYENSEQFEKATTTINAYLQNNPNDIRALMQKRGIENQQGTKRVRPDEDLYKLINQCASSDVRNLFVEGKFKDVIDFVEPNLQKILSYNLKSMPKSYKLKLSGLMNGVGSCYLYTKQNDHALDALTLAVALIPESPSSWSGIGKIHLNRKEFDDAMKAYKEVIKYSAKSAYGHAGMAYCYSAQGMYGEALPFLQKAVNFSTNDQDKQEYARALADCKSKLGR